jgi:hypothetical protein
VTLTLRKIKERGWKGSRKKERGGVRKYLEKGSKQRWVGGKVVNEAG